MALHMPPEKLFNQLVSKKKHLLIGHNKKSRLIPSSYSIKMYLWFCILQMPFTQACLSSENPYERKGGLMCMAVLAEGCADHIRTK